MTEFTKQTILDSQQTKAFLQDFHYFFPVDPNSTIAGIQLKQESGSSRIVAIEVPRDTFRQPHTVHNFWLGIPMGGISPVEDITSDKFQLVCFHSKKDYGNDSQPEIQQVAIHPGQYALATRRILELAAQSNGVPEGSF